MASLRGEPLGGQGDVDDRDPVGPGREPGPDAQLVQPAELLDAGGLAGGGVSGHDQAAAGADLPLVHQHQHLPLGGDLGDRRGGDHDQLGVMGDPGLVVVPAVPLAQRLPLLGG
jgi:hypothetical protein